MAQDYDKDLFIVLTGTGITTIKNFVDNVEDYIFGDRDEREATLLVPLLPQMSGSMSRVLTEWAIGEDDEPNYPVHVFKCAEVGHKVVAKAKEVITVTADDRVYMDSAELERAMNELVKLQREGNEVAVVVLYDEDEDVKLVGELKNYNSIPVLNLNGMIDDFPGFKTTDEILKEEREREEFETKEAIRIAAEKEQEKLEKAANAPAKKAAAPRKRAAAKPVEDKPLTATKRAAKKVAPPKPEEIKKELEAESVSIGEKEPEHKVGDTVVVEGIPFTKHSELPSELEPAVVVKPQEMPSGAVKQETLGAVPDLWADVSKAQASLSVPGDKLVVSKESMAQLSEGIKEMSLAYAKTIDAFTTILKEK
jgi:hypothetical protein